MEENKPVETSDVKLNENSNTEVKIEGAEQVLNQEQAQPPSTQTPESPETAPIVSETSEPNKEQAQPSTTESPELTEPTTEKQSGPDKEQDKPEIKQQIQNDDESYEDVDDDYEDDVEDLKLKLDTGTEPSNPNAPQNELRDYEFEDDEEIKAEDYELNLGEEIQKLSLDEAKKSEKISKDNALKQKYSEHDNRGSDDTSTVKDDTKPTKSGSEKWTHDKYEKKKGDDSTSNKPKQQQQRQRQPQQRSNKPNERILQHLGSPSSSGNKQNESSGKLQRAQGQGHQKQNTQPKGLILSEYLEQNEQGAKKTAESGTTHKKQDTVQQLNQEKKHPQRREQTNQSSAHRGASTVNAEKPTSPSDLKKRLNYSTRIPTIFDDLYIDNNRQQAQPPQQQQQQQQSIQNKPSGNYNNRPNTNFNPRGSNNSGSSINSNNPTNTNNAPVKRFDKPFDKNDKLDLVITTDFTSSNRHVIVNQANTSYNQASYFNNEDRFDNYRKSNRNHSNPEADYAEYIGNNPHQAGSNVNNNSNSFSTRGVSNRKFQQYSQHGPEDSNFNEYLDYTDYSAGANLSEYAGGGGAPVNVKTQTFRNRNFKNQSNSFDQSSSTGPNRAFLDQLGAKPHGRPITRANQQNHGQGPNSDFNQTHNRSNQY